MSRKGKERVGNRKAVIKGGNNLNRERVVKNIIQVSSRLVK